MKKSYKIRPFGLLPCLALTIASSEAAITYVDDGSFIDGVINAPAGTKTVALNAGATADMLIVGVSTEFGGGGTFTATYGTHTMAYATGNFNQSNLFYIDLTATTYTGGSADLVLTWSHTAGGDVGIGWASVDGNLLAGESIELHSTAFGTASVDLVTTVDSTFNFVNFNGNKRSVSGTTAVDSPLTQIYANAGFGSNAGGAGYEADVNSGTNTYSWVHDNDRRIDAAAFVVVPVPEPSSTALLGVAGLSLLLRRRRL